jgi:hypothetical protein
MSNISGQVCGSLRRTPRFSSIRCQICAHTASASALVNARSTRQWPRSMNCAMSPALSTMTAYLTIDTRRVALFNGECQELVCGVVSNRCCVVGRQYSDRRSNPVWCETPPAARIGV